MKENNILVYIHQKLTGEISSEGEILVKEWLAESQDNQDYFNDIKKSWELSLQVEDSYEPDVEAGFTKFQARIAADKIIAAEPKSGKVSPLALLFKVAAVLLVAAGIGYLLNPYLNNPEIAGPFVTVENESMVVELPDGSLVWMHENSELSLDNSFRKGNRNIQFSGTALFDIEHNPAHPFYIDGGHTDVKVLGTKFIYNTGNGLSTGSVNVLEGKVQFSIDESDEAIILTRNEAGKIDNTINLQKVPFADTPFAKESNKLVFRNVPLNRAVEIFEQQYKVQLDWADQNRILDCGLVSDYKNAKLEDVFESLQLSFGIDIRQTSETAYKLVGGACPE